jgi:hypothetical protein
MKLIVQILLLCLILFSGFKCTQYVYNDCKKVGHSTTYCVFKLLHR